MRCRPSAAKAALRDPSAVRERIADPKHALHGKHLRLSVAPHPYNATFVVVTAATSWGPSTFTVSRGGSGGMRITLEELCYPPYEGPPRPTSTRLPQAVPDHPDTCAGEVRPHPAQRDPAIGATPVRAVRQRATEPDHPLHGRRVYVPPVPKPYGQRTVVVAESPHGPSRFRVKRGATGGWILTGEEICHPPASARPTPP